MLLPALTLSSREAATFEHCWAYGTGCNLNMQGRLADNRTEVDGTGHTLRNNAGADIGFPFCGAAPDLGAFEAPRALTAQEKKEKGK